MGERAAAHCRGSAMKNNKPSLDEIQFLIDALAEKKVPVDEIRGEIIDALEWLHLEIFGNEFEARWAKGGRPIAMNTTHDASIVATLKDEHRIPIKAGLWAVESGLGPKAERRRQAIARKCSDIRNDKAAGYRVTDGDIQAALEKIRNRK